MRTVHVRLEVMPTDAGQLPLTVEEEHEAEAGLRRQMHSGTASGCSIKWCGSNEHEPSPTPRKQEAHAIRVLTSSTPGLWTLSVRPCPHTFARWAATVAKKQASSLDG